MLGAPAAKKVKKPSIQRQLAEATEGVEFVEEEIESSQSSGEEEKEIQDDGHLKVAGSSGANSNPLQLSLRMSTAAQVFERFDGIDIHQSTLHSLVEEMEKRRDLTDNGI